MPDLLFVVNPKAGRKSIRSKILEITDGFIKAGYNVSIHITQGTGDCTKYLRRHGEAFDNVVCCGGDGTLSETVNGLAHLENPPVIGYISGGTTNDVGFSLNLPFDMVEASKVAVGGIPIRWDIGKFGDRFFCYVAAFGMFTELTYSTDQEAKNLLGRTAYMLEGAKSLSSVKSYPTVIECDGAVTEGDFILCMVSNTVSVGGFRTVFGSDAKLTDGEFEIVAVKSPKTLEDINHIAAILLQLESADEIKSEFLTFARGKKINIKVKETVAWTVDGEYGGTFSEANIEVLPRLLTIMSGDPAKVGDRRGLLSRLFKKRRK